MLWFTCSSHSLYRIDPQSVTISVITEFERKEIQMTDEIVAANKELVRRFYKEVYGDWNMKLVDEVVSPQFISHDWPRNSPIGPEGFRNFYSAIRSAVPDARYEV